MRVRIEHTTSFVYDEPIVEAYTELRLRPLDGAGQHCAAFRITTDPIGVRVRSFRDHVGNEIHHFDVLEPHDRLDVTATSEVLTPFSYVDTERLPGMLELHDYLARTSYVPLSDEVRAFAAEHAGTGTEGERATRLSQAIHREFTYETGVTDVHTGADEVLAIRRGVCQDFAHLLLAACRSSGIVCRYVSGYLYDASLDGDNAASHAWVDVLDEARGWISLDPTHDREQTEAYVRVAVGRDYEDVPPTRGVFKGVAHEKLAVHVVVTPG
jgi:transglutaminase-like putative cysteine protease